MLLANLPRALGYRRRAKPTRMVAAREVAGWFVPRGYNLPPKAAPPQDKVWQATAEEREAMQADAPPAYPLASVVLLNLNGLDMTKRCLKALGKQTYPELEIIVVDNGSAVDEARLLGIEFPRVKTLRLERNLGFSGGVNWGVSLTRGEYIVLVNNDTVPHEDCVRNLVYAAKRTGAAAVSGRLIDLPDSGLLEHAVELLDIELDPDAEVAGGVEPALWDAFEDSRLNHALTLYGYIVPGGWGEEPGCFYPSGEADECRGCDGDR